MHGAVGINEMEVIMNRKARVSLLASGIVAAFMAIVAVFMLGNMVPTGIMEHIEVNGRVIPMNGARLNYKFDVPVMKNEPVDGVLVMRDGTEYSISCSLDFDVFTIDDKFGMYVFG